MKDVDIVEFREYIKELSIIGNVFGHSMVNQMRTI